jgi:hypothetical protein
VNSENSTAEICQAVASDKSKLAGESESNCTSKEEEILEVPPTNAQMPEALCILCRVMQHKAIHSGTTKCKQTTGNTTQVF